MITSPVTAVNQSQNRLTGDLQLVIDQEKDNWLKTITFGQILKGKILRVYSENKYGVSFGGQERVVDSSIPLTVGSSIKGRITSITDSNVSLKLLPSTNDSLVDTLEQEAISAGLASNSLGDLEQFSKDQQIVIDTVARQLGDKTLPPAIASALRSLGMPIESELLREIAYRVRTTSPVFKGDYSDKLPILNLGNQQLSGLAITELVEKFSKYWVENYENQLKKTNSGSNFTLEDDAVLGVQQFKNDASGSQDRYRKFERLIFTLLNGNNQENLQHRFQVLPLMIDGQLVEFDVALFDQKNSQQNVDGVITSRSIKFSLETQSGKVHIEAKVLNNRVGLAFSADNPQMLMELESTQSQLNEELANANWIPDKVSYKLISDEMTASLRVVEHLFEKLNGLYLEV